MAIALVDANGVAWVEGFGETERGGHEPVTADTLFSIQSVSKHFTALGFLRAVERGLVRLDEPLADVKRGFVVHSRLGDAEASRITFRQLLSHWSGLAHEAPVGGNYDFSDISFDDHIRSISDTWLKARPGERYSYSNLGFDLAGAALQSLSGKPFADYEREAVFEPLGMTSSTFDVGRDAPAGVAKGHPEDGAAGVLPYIPMVPAGGMFASVRDLAKVLRMHLGGGAVDGRSYLPATLLNEMYTRQFSVSGQTAGYGLGIQSQVWRGQTEYFHAGGGFGYSAIFEWVPAYRVGVVVLSNAPNSDIYQIASRAMARQIALRAGTEPPKPTPTASVGVTVATEDLQRLEGTYRLGNNPLIRFEVRNGRLLCLGVDASPIELVPRSATELVDASGTFQMHFVFDLDASGAPKGFRELGNFFAGTYYALNDRPHEAPGPNRAAWSGWLGSYTVTTHGAIWESGVHGFVARTVGSAIPLQVEVRNGDLYAIVQDERKSLMGIKLTEWAPGLFFTADGETLKFEPGRAIFRNVTFLKQR
jgi:CubicO group peptidase (beta-lactamase class C family)